MASSYFERERHEVGPVPAGNFALGSREYGKTSLTQDEVKAIKATGDSPVSLSRLGIAIKDGELGQVSAVWTTMGVNLSLNPETGDVVFPGRQIEEVARAFDDTRFILIDHFKGPEPKVSYRKAFDRRGH